MRKMVGERIREHEFFEGVDWEKVEKKEVEVIFRPVVKGERDVDNFDTKFTGRRVNGSLASVGGEGIAVLQDFSYVFDEEIGKNSESLKE
jgi:serum/glucocorticoid-regulated kinase 2